LYRQGEVFTAKGDLARGINIEELAAGVLKYRADCSRSLGEGLFVNFLSVYKNRAGKKPIKKVRNKAVYKTGERRLPATALSAEDDKLAVLDYKIDRLHTPRLFPRLAVTKACVP
jgi:hypothetical protein